MCFKIIKTPEPSTTGLAQLVEHWSPKPGVGSSSLSTRARINDFKPKPN